MQIWYVEHRTIDAKRLTADIAQHLRGRYNLGRTIIIADRPLVVLSTLRKQWLKEVERLYRARSSTLDAVKILQLSQELTGMEMLRFDATSPNERAINVRIIGPEQINKLPDNCMTIYLGSTQKIDADKLMSQLPNKAMIVDYNGSVLTPAKLSSAVVSSYGFSDLLEVISSAPQTILQKGRAPS